MIVPAQKNQDLLADISAASEAESAFHVWWLGQSGFLLKWRTHRLLFDPYLSDSLTAKYAQTDKPHVRMTELAVDPSNLTGISVITSSHNHTDHLDAETLLPLALANPQAQLVLPAANLEFAENRLGTGKMPMQGLDDGQTLQAGPFEFTGIAAAHNEVERDDQGRCVYLGFVVKFGDFCVYHSGDTMWHSGLVRRIAPHRPDIAFVPVNGYKPERRVAGNLDGREAAAVAKGIGAGIAIPHHFEMFEFNTEPPELFVESCERFRQAYVVLRCGERWTIAKDEKK